MRRLIFIPILLTALWLQGCAAVTAVSAVPGALIEVAATQFKSEEKSFPRHISTTLAAVQASLSSMKLDVDVLEIQENGYAIAFGNEKLDGKITLEEMTPKLTTMQIKVRRKMREASVEQAIIASVEARLDRMKKNRKQSFQFAGYDNLMTEPDAKTKRVGWYRKSAKLETYRNGKSEWLKVKLPSGKTAYMRSEIVEAKNVAKKGGKS